MKRGTPNHPKTLWLKAGLGISKREVVGLLEMLFHFTASCSPQGDIGKWTNQQIAEALEWVGDADELVAHIADAGFVDHDRVYRLVVHDWPEHADGAVKKHLQRSKLEFVAATPGVQTVSGRKPRKSGQIRPAVAVALPIHALPIPPLPEVEPEPIPLEPPLPVYGRLLEEATCPACQNRGTIRSASGGRGYFCGTKLGGCGQSFDLVEPAILDQLTERAREAILRRAGPPPAPRPVPTSQDRANPPEENALFDRRRDLASEFVAWLKLNPDAGVVMGKSGFVGEAIGKWPGGKALPGWVRAAVLKVATELVAQPSEPAVPPGDPARPHTFHDGGMRAKADRAPKCAWCFNRAEHPLHGAA